MTEEKIEGQWDQAKGDVKEGVGKVTGDESTEAEGKWDQFKGNVEEKVGEAKDTWHRKTDGDPNT